MVPFSYSSFDGPGGSDESYDAADFQNMLMALVPVDPELPDNPNSPMNVDDIVQPSLHRRALVNYWERRLETASGMTPNTLRFSAGPKDPLPLTAPQAALARKVVLRPLAFDHPNFPELENAVNGPWDVDNDGDGVPDSIWVDLGYPVMKDASGRQFKPMFAILCQDLDGRLNVNAHGSRFDVARENGNLLLVDGDFRSGTARQPSRRVGQSIFGRWKYFL